MHGQAVALRQFLRHLAGQGGRKPLALVDARQLVELALGVILQFACLARQIGPFRVALR